MIVRKVYPAKVIVLSIAVAAVTGHKPLVGFADEVEKAWEKLKKKFGLLDRMKSRKTPLRSASQSNLDQVLKNDPTEPSRAQTRYAKRQASETKMTMEKFKKMDDQVQNSYYNDDVFSKSWVPPKFDKNAPDYGRPKRGSLTEKRGIEAGNHICKEIIYLCEVIDENGVRDKCGCVTIPFGKLFSIYVHISDKVVGMLLRARRHNMVSFEGEMLFQRQDDHVLITLLRPLDQVRQFYAASNDPARCVATAL